MADIERVTSVDELWSLLSAARRDGDEVEVARIKARMASIQASLRWDGVSDEELESRIASLSSSLDIQRVKHAGVMEDTRQNRLVDELNQAMRDAVDPDARKHLDELLREKKRRLERNAYWNDPSRQ